MHMSSFVLLCNSTVTKSQLALFQSFPHARNMNDPSFLRKLSKDAARQRHNLNVERENYTQEDDLPFTEYMFLPNFSLQGDVNEESFDVSIIDKL